MDLFDNEGSWDRGEPDHSDVAYYNRPMKTFNRMFPDRCLYKKMDNRKFMQCLTL